MALIRTGPDADLECPDCGARYPSVDGVPVVLRDPSPVLEQPVRRDDGDAWCDALADADPASDTVREAWLLTMYALSHHPAGCPSAFARQAMRDQDTLGTTLQRWLATHGPIGGDALELGCGVAGHASLWRDACGGSVTLCDLRLAMLTVGRDLHAGRSVVLPWRRVGRRYAPISLSPAAIALPNVHYVVGDAIDPPFAAERFGLVVALNLLDAIRDPWMLLGQLDALTSAGGLLLLGQPFHYEPHAQHPDGWFDGPQGLEEALMGHLAGLEHLRYEVLERTDDVPWSLPAHDRLVHRYGMHVLLARKRSAEDETG